jgi:cyclic pyranopterin phosphate synthase
MLPNGSIAGTDYTDTVTPRRHPHCHERLRAILTSPQTAVIVAQAWGDRSRIVVPDLAEGHWPCVSRAFTGCKGDDTVALVGHERWIATLTARPHGRRNHRAFAYLKGGAALSCLLPIGAFKLRGQKLDSTLPGRVFGAIPVVFGNERTAAPLRDTLVRSLQGEATATVTVETMVKRATTHERCPKAEWSIGHGGADQQVSRSGGSLSANDCYDRKISCLLLSVTDACNLRCKYCAPAEGSITFRRGALLSFKEMVALTRQAVGFGIDRVRLTGGEPLVRWGIVRLVAMLREISGLRDVAMTSNGILLSGLARDLRRAGLGGLTISLDTLDPKRFRDLSGGGDLRKVLAGIDAAVAEGFETITLNCVVEFSPDETDARQVAGFGRERGIDVRFIRRMGLHQGRLWPICEGDSGHCYRCNRLRVACDGRVSPCLFDDQSFSIRRYGIDGALRLAVGHKPATGLRCDVAHYEIGVNA